MIDLDIDTLTFNALGKSIRTAATGLPEASDAAGIQTIWVAVLIAQTEYGVMPAIDVSEFLLDDIVKHAFFTGLPEWIKMMQCTRVALLMPAWRTVWEPNADGSPYSVDDRVPPREDPNRDEVLNLYLAERGRIETWTADVLRRANDDPYLGEWELMQTKGVTSGGQALDALRAGFA